MLKWLKRNTAAGDTPPPPPPAVTADPDELMREAFPLHEAGKIDEAARLYRTILEIAPQYADAHYLLGRIAQDRGDTATALRHVRDAVRCNDREAAFQKTLGEIHFGLGHWQEATVYLGNAVARDPADGESWNNLGCAYEKLGRLADATRHFRKALELAPDSAMVLNNVAMTLKDRGRADEALAVLGAARAKFADDADLFSNYLYTLNFSSRFSAQQIFEEHLGFDRVYGTGRFGSRPRRRPGPDPERRLRLAYFSPDFRAHPISVFLEAPLRAHDRRAFEVTCYFLHPWADAVTEKMKTMADRWVDCRGLNDDQIAARIEADEIDILVDLAGHTGHGRLPVLGRAPAPVLVTWLGYPNTTGLRTVDYRLTDARFDPEGSADRFYTEKLVRLPVQWCYTRPATELAVTALPAAQAGRVRFGSFNNAAKLTDEMLQLWSGILQRVEGARLLVWGVGEEQSAHIREVCRNGGADPERLEFSDRTGFTEQLRLYQQVDIALDTHPYSGVTTTFNSLWMGVPVVTLAGETPASRGTHAILGGLDLDDWSARSPAEYADIAVRHAHDLAALSKLRPGLRARLENSPLMDGKTFTASLEAAYRTMWRERCKAGA